MLGSILGKQLRPVRQPCWDVYWMKCVFFKQRDAHSSRLSALVIHLLLKHLSGGHLILQEAKTQLQKLNYLLSFAFLYLFRGFVCMQILLPFRLSISLSCRDGNCYWAPSLSSWLFRKQGLYLHPGVTEASLYLNLHCAHTHFISLIPVPVVSVAQWLGTGVIEKRETWAGGNKINSCSKPKSVCIPVSRGQFFRENQSESEPHSKTA